MATIELRQIRKVFNGTEIIKGVDLTLHDRELTVFVGPSGCGKSTLLRLIAGLEEITSGEMLLDGRRMNEVAPAKRDLALVFQSYALYPHMTVAENMSFALKLAGVPKAERDRKVAEAARILTLEDLLERRPKDLSGGQRQRVAIGRAIVRSPKVFLFDEPLSNLDAALRVRMRLELSKLHHDLQATMVYVTHDQVEAMTMADRIVVLRAGRVEQVGSPMELYRRPANQFVAGFLGSPRMNFLKHDKDQTLGIRPEHITLAASGGVAAKVEVVEHLGSESFLYLTTEVGEPLTVKTGADTEAQSGDRVHAVFDPRHLHFFDPDGLAVPGASHV